MLRFITAVVLLGAAVPAMAEDWRSVAVLGAAPDRKAALIDGDQIDRTNPAMPQARTGLLREIPTDGDISLIVSWVEFDCAAKTSRVTFIEGYDLDGDMHLREPVEETHQPIKASTSFDYYRIVACENRWGARMTSNQGKSIRSVAAGLFGS